MERRSDGCALMFLDESNATGTACLRTSMLPEAQRAEARRLLREYVDLRIAATQGAPMEEPYRKS